MPDLEVSDPRSIHRARLFRSAWPGIEAVSLVSSRSFSRHAHDEVGFGVLDRGGHRSWSGRGTVEAESGHIITVNPGEMHDGHPVQQQPRMWRMLYVDPERLRALVPGLWSDATEIIRPVLHDPVLRTRFDLLFAALIEPGSDAMLIEEGLLLTLDRLLSTHANRIQRPEQAPSRTSLALALDRIRQAPAERMTLTELAALTGVSRYRFLRDFTRAVGVTPHAFIVQQRVRLARRLLAAGQTPVGAALAAGFADQSHLNRAFKRQLGLTPGHYRTAKA